MFSPKSYLCYVEHESLLTLECELNSRLSVILGAMKVGDFWDNSLRALELVSSLDRFWVFDFAKGLAKAKCGGIW